MPRLVVDLERLKYLHCGLGQFSLHLGRSLLAECPSEWRPTFLVPAVENAFQLTADQVLIADLWRREAVQRLFRPMANWWRQTPTYDLWHVTHQDSRFWPLDPRIPVVLTIHDLNFLRTKSPPVIRRRQRALQKKINRATVLTTGSAHAAWEIREHFHLRGKPMRVITHGVCLDSAVTAERPGGIAETDRFLFTIGDIRPSKNFHVLVDMLKHLPGLLLVIAGSKKDSYAAMIEQRAGEMGLADRLRMPGRVSENERLWLYQHCEALVFPSLAEGFGLPLIEAMHCGRPVFSSRCTSLPEVGGELAFYWDHFDPESMAATVQAGMQRFRSEPDYSDRLRARSRQFSWPQVARAYFDLYRGVLSGSALAAGSAA